MCIAIVHNLLSQTPAGAPIPSPAKLHAFFYFLICLFAFNNCLSSYFAVVKYMGL